MRNLSIAEKRTVNKLLAVSKITNLVLAINMPKTVIWELNKIQKNLLGGVKTINLKHSISCNRHENGDLRKVDILFKIKSLNFPG